MENARWSTHTTATSTAYEQWAAATIFSPTKPGASIGVRGGLISPTATLWASGTLSLEQGIGARDYSGNVTLAKGLNPNAIPIACHRIVDKVIRVTWAFCPLGYSSSLRFLVARDARR
jgi:hypothetical protein